MREIEQLVKDAVAGAGKRNPTKKAALIFIADDIRRKHGLECAGKTFVNGLRVSCVSGYPDGKIVVGMISR